MAQVAAGRLGGIRLREVFAAHGTERVLGYIEELLARAETLTRREIESIPDGEYRFEDCLDNDGVELDRRVKIAVTVHVRGSAMTFDFTGTDPQVRGPFNSVPASTLSAIYYAIRAISDPSIPNNGGCFRAVDAVLPEGTVVNPRPPAPVSCRTATIKRIADTILGALVRARPGRMPAANSGTLLVMAFGGQDPATGRPFVASELAAGGMGARPRKDGIDVIETDVTNCMNIPVESLEMGFPPAHPPCRPLGGLGWRGAVPRRARPREGVRGHDRRRQRLASRRALRLDALGAPRRRARPLGAGLHPEAGRLAGGAALEEDDRAAPGRPALGVRPGRRRATATRSSATRNRCWPTCWTARFPAPPRAKLTEWCSRPMAARWTSSPRRNPARRSVASAAASTGSSTAVSTAASPDRRPRQRTENS